MVQISTSSLPSNASIGNALHVIHYSDCFYVEFTSGKNFSLADCVRYLFNNLPVWMVWLLKLRDILVKPLGLKTGNGEDNSIPIINIYEGGMISLFNVLECNEDEMLLYASDKHLDVCLSIQMNASFHQYKISISTIVQFHNAGGRIYFFLIKPFHILVVKSMLLRIAKHFC